MTEIFQIPAADAILHVEATGDGAPLILVAGLGGRGAFWSRQIAPLAEHFRVMTFDHRGCGSSTRDRPVTSVAHMAADVLAILDALGIARAHLVGHSTGGAIGQHLGVHHPHRLDRLVLSASWPGPDPYFLTLFRNRRAILERCGPLAYLENGTFLATPSFHLQPMMRDDVAGIAQRVAAFPGLAVELSRIDAVMAHDLRAELHRVKAPTLCIGARDDQITPPGFTEELARLIPGARQVLLDRGGHFCPIVQTAAYTAAVLEFLTEGSTDD